MKRILLGALCTIMLLALTISCQPRYILVPMPGTTTEEEHNPYILSFRDLKDKLENGEDGEYYIAGVLVDPESEELPINVSGNKTVRGSVRIVANQPSTALSKAILADTAEESAASVIFAVQDNATVSFSDFSVDIDESVAEKVDAVISVDSGKLSVASMTVSVESEDPSTPAEPVVGVAVGDKATAENVTVSSSAITVTVSEGNEDKTLVENLSKAEGATVETPWDVSTSVELNAAIATYGKARLTSDIKELSAKTFETNADIDLNNKTLNIHVSQRIGFACLFIRYGADVVIHNGTLITEKPNETDDTRGGIRVMEGSTLTLNNINWTSDHSGLFVTNDNSKFYADNLDLYINGIYTVSTNAGIPVSGIEIEIRNSKLVQDSPEGKEGNTGILFNIDGKLVLDNTYVEAGSQALIARGGDVDIINGSKIYSTGEATAESKEHYKLTEDAEWGTGNEVPYAALVVGNATEGSYDYPTDVYIDETSTVEMKVNEGVNDEAARIYLASANGQPANLTTSNETYISEIVDGGLWRGTTTEINGEMLTKD